MSHSSSAPAPGSPPPGKRSRLSLKLRFGRGGAAPASPSGVTVPNGSSTRVGLLPSRGWQQRNLQFLNDVLIPTFLAPRLPGGTSSFLAGLDFNQTGITWLGHAGFLVHIGGRNILIDPNWALWHGPVKRISHPSLTSRNLPYIDLVLISHAHFDHLHLPSLRAVAAGQPIIVPQGVGNVVKGCAFSQVIELDYWKSTELSGLKVTFVPTKHWGARFIHDTYRQYGAFLIQCGDQTVFHCGDSSMFDGFQEIGKHAKIDIALMPIGAYRAPSGRPVHMNPEEAIEAADMMGATNLIPMHYGTFPLGGEPIREPAERLIQSASRLGWDDRVQLLPEGHTAVFGR